MLHTVFNPATKTKLVSTQSEDALPLKFILTEKEKFADDRAAVKRIFRFHESMGTVQVSLKDRDVRKCYNLAYGKVNMEDYVEVDSQYAAATGVPDAKLEDLNIDFYPIIPTFVRGVLGSYDKMYSEYSAQAVNPEATNEILAKVDEDLRSVLIGSLESLFQTAAMGESADAVKQKQEMIAQSQEVQGFYKARFRTTVEEWAGHTMNLEDAQFNMKDIERRLLEQEVVTGDPTVHVKLQGGKYRPEILVERDTFCTRAPGARDYSKSQVFGWFDYCTFSDILNEHGPDMTTEQVEKMSRWSQSWLGETMAINGMSQPFTKGQSYAESAHNVRTVESVIRFHQQRKFGETYGTVGDIVKKTTIYFYVPRKYGTLTFKNGQEMLTEVVDEQFKVTMKPVYEPGRPKQKEYLVSGEHVDWYYKPELWRGIKVSTFGFSPTGTGVYGTDDNEIWIELGRCEVQFEDPFTEEVCIPVHGGSITNQYNDSTSPVRAAAPWQIMYNWVWNRNKQLLATEIGKFYALPDAAIPNESLDGSWDLYGLQKFVSTARDTQVASLAGGALNPNAPSSFGSVVDLTNTQDILNKATLAQTLEAACYRSIGVTPEFLLGDFSSEQSAKSVAMGQQRTATQLQSLFTRVTEVVTRARATMLQSAQYLAGKSPTVQMTYTTPQSGRVLFRVPTAEFPLHKLGVFPKSNGADLAVIESIKNYVAGNNTMGADSYEMATLLSFKTMPELFSRLKDIHDRKAAEKQQEMQHERDLQQQQIQAAQAQLDRELAQKAEENALDRDRDIMVAQIRTVGYAEGTAEDVQNAILGFQDANARQQELYARAESHAKIAATKERTAQQDLADKRNKLALEQRFKLKEAQQKDRELDLYEMDIKARNARTKALG